MRHADLTVHYIATDWQKADLSAGDQALCTYADKLTNHPQMMTEADILFLKESGFDDRAIHDATQVISYFNYINRIADALDVATEDFVHAWEQSAPTRAPVDAKRT
ncbi:MAG: peroxidase [Chloroflexota bacterium]